MVLEAALLNTQHYKVGIKGKVGNPRKGVAPSLTQCSSYWKGSLRISLDYGHQLYFYLLHVRASIFIHTSHQVEFNIRLF